MDCKTAQSLIIPYIRDELSEDQEDAFLHHVLSCRECYEELEIFYTVSVALQKLDEDDQISYDMRNMLHNKLKEAEHRIIRRKLIHYFSCAVILAAEVLLALMLLGRPAAINFFRVPAETEETETETEEETESAKSQQEAGMESEESQRVNRSGNEEDQQVNRSENEEGQQANRSEKEESQQETVQEAKAREAGKNGGTP